MSTADGQNSIGCLAKTVFDGAAVYNLPPLLQVAFRSVAAQRHDLHLDGGRGGGTTGDWGTRGAMKHILFPETSGPPTARGHAYPPCRASQSSQPEVTPFQWVTRTAKQGWAQSWPSDRCAGAELQPPRTFALFCESNRRFPLFRFSFRSQLRSLL